MTTLYFWPKFRSQTWNIFNQFVSRPYGGYVVHFFFLWNFFSWHFQTLSEGTWLCLRARNLRVRWTSLTFWHFQFSQSARTLKPSLQNTLRRFLNKKKNKQQLEKKKRKNLHPLWVFCLSLAQQQQIFPLLSCFFNIGILEQKPQKNKKCSK